MSRSTDGVSASDRLVAIAKHLLRGDEAETPERVLRAALEQTGAERGFVVVREGESYEERFQVRFDRAALSNEERRFSRSLVHQAISKRAIVDAADTAGDPTFSSTESVKWLRARAVLVVPLVHEGVVFGVLYLDRPGAPAFSDAARAFVAELADLAGAALHRASEREALRRRLQSLESDLFAQYDFKGIITRDVKMTKVLGVVGQVADSSATVLLRGETGTGKELVARALHVNSGRSKKPFVPLHTTALPATVLESELFGHARGAFTNADRDRPGRIASADGGTLFLDEVAEIPLEAQAKLLRFLQFGEIQRLGADRTEKVDVRVVAASHQDLGSLVAAGKFRQDLFFRLKVIELELPPLRERAVDVPVLLDAFLAKYWRRKGETPAFTERARRALETYAWPGNVRELENLVERVALLATGPTLDVDLFPEDVARPRVVDGSPSSFARFDHAELEAAREGAIQDVERRFLEGLLHKHGGNVSQAARASNINRTYLQKLLGRYRGNP